jgi:hypothetical protein
MNKRSKPALQWRHGSVGFLDPWLSPSDRALDAVMRRHSDRTSRGETPNVVDDRGAVALLALLNLCGLVIGWTLFVS